MNIYQAINKARAKGVLGCVKAITKRICRIVNRSAFYAFGFFPINEELIIFESEGDFSDNSYALYDFLESSGHLEHKKTVWLVDNLFQNAKKSGIIVCNKSDDRIDLKRSFYLATCSFYIYDHCNAFSSLRKRSKQKIVCLWHGTALKAPGKYDNQGVISHPDIIASTGALATKHNAVFLNEEKGRFVELGYPRNDYFFGQNSEIMEKVKKTWCFSGAKKLILWMPTFRQSNNKSLSQDYINSETGLPLIDTIEELNYLNSILDEENVVLILKIHHLQSELPVFKTCFSHIIILKDDDLKQMGIQLYQFLGIADALITDYSSVSLDYLLLDKPMIFTVDDYNDYKNSRGFISVNTLDYLPGPHVVNLDGLIAEIKKATLDIDEYSNQRKEVKRKFHTYTDGGSSKRIAEHLKL